MSKSSTLRQQWAKWYIVLKTVYLPSDKMYCRRYLRSLAYDICSGIVISRLEAK